MKQVVELVESLERKYKLNIEKLLELYQKNLPRDVMAEKLGVQEWTIRTVMNALNCRMAKKYRAHDYSYFLSRYGDASDVELVEELQEMKEDLDQLSKDLVNKEFQLKKARREVNKYRRAHGEPLDIPELLRSIIKPIELPTITSAPTAIDKYRDYTQLVILSDLHCEEIVSPKDVGISNVYNWEEFERRLSLVFSEVIDNYRGEHKCIIASIGDQISGIIHDTLESTGKYTGEAVADIAKLLAKYTNTLAVVYDKVEVVAVTGNHSRLSDHRKSTANGFNLEYLMFEIWKALTTTNVTFNFGHSGYIVAEIGGKHFGFHHGDYHRAGFGTTKSLKIQDAFRQATGIMPYHIAQGHLHTPMIENMHTGGQYITNGSMIGANSYSHSSGFTGLPWSQTTILLDQNGNIEFSRWITG